MVGENEALKTTALLTCPYMPDMVQKKSTDITRFFDERGYLREPVVAWMHEALGLDVRSIRQTRFKKARSLPYHAHTFYKTVRYLDPDLETNATHTYSVRNWLNLIAHELYHRQEIGNTWFSALYFGLSYAYHWVKNGLGKKHPYRDNPHEIRAFAVGCDTDSKVNRWMEANPGFWEE